MSIIFLDNVKNKIKHHGDMKMMLLFRTSLFAFCRVTTWERVLFSLGQCVDSIFSRSRQITWIWGSVIIYLSNICSKWYKIQKLKFLSVKKVIT